MDLTNFYTALPSVGSFKIVVNDLACIDKKWKQFRYPKTKKARIRKKWSKRNLNFRFEEVHRMVIMKDQNTVVVSQKTFDTIKNNPKIKETKWT